MACREITILDNTDYIIKAIPISKDSNLNEVEWPEPYSVVNNINQLEKCFKDSNCNNFLKQAIIQQYNEILLYHEVDMYDRLLLAPQCSVSISKPGALPEIIYPKFIPLCSDSDIWKYDEKECLILLGMRAKEYNIISKQLFHFLNSAQNLCLNWNLREEDILYNPSNIGYHPIFGLRIIDYGLAYDKDKLILAD